MRNSVPLRGVWVKNLKGAGKPFSRGLGGGGGGGGVVIDKQPNSQTVQ